MKKHSAFSLIELSIVILIIGILIAGITQSSRLVKQARLKTARTLTQSSPVAGIADLLLWYETSLASSFDDAEQSDGTEITTWYDNNPQTISKNNASLDNGDGGTACSSNPKFYENVFNSGIPAVRFTGGTDECLRFKGDALIESSFTVFVVEQRRTSNPSYFIGGGTNSFHFGYNSEKVVRFVTNGISADYSSIPTYNSATPRIHTAILNNSSSKSYWLNGGTTADKTQTASSSDALTTNSSPSLGRRGGAVTYYFIGDLAEIIIFTSALKTEERQAIEDYLSKKYGITIS